MISFINGKLIEILDNQIIVETSGVGFAIYFPKSNFINLPPINENVKVYTYMNVKEDEISLYGFLTSNDREMFLKLLTVNGVGPKGALNIISTFGFSELMNIIANNDDKTIASVQGIGQKTASKICIELGDKVRKMKFDGAVDIIKKNKEMDKKYEDVRLETIQALTKLGYKENKARDIVMKLEIKEEMTASELLKLALSKNKI